MIVLSRTWIVACSSSSSRFLRCPRAVTTAAGICERITTAKRGFECARLFEIISDSNRAVSAPRDRGRESQSAEIGKYRLDAPRDATRRRPRGGARAAINTWTDACRPCGFRPCCGKVLAGVTLIMTAAFVATLAGQAFCCSQVGCFRCRVCARRRRRHRRRRQVQPTRRFFRCAPPPSPPLFRCRARSVAAGDGCPCCGGGAARARLTLSGARTIVVPCCRTWVRTVQQQRCRQQRRHTAP